MSKKLKMPDGGSYLPMDKLLLASKKLKESKKASSPFKGNEYQDRTSEKKATSIVDYLKSFNYDSSFKSRKELANRLGITGYTGSTNQNEALLSKLKASNTSINDIGKVSNADYMQQLYAMHPQIQTGPQETIRMPTQSGLTAGQEFNQRVNSFYDNVDRNSPISDKVAGFLNKLTLGAPQAISNMAGTAESLLEDVGRRVTGNHTDGQQSVNNQDVINTALALLPEVAGKVAPMVGKAASNLGRKVVSGVTGDTFSGIQPLLMGKDEISQEAGSVMKQLYNERSATLQRQGAPTRDGVLFNELSKTKAGRDALEYYNVLDPNNKEAFKSLKKQPFIKDFMASNKENLDKIYSTTRMKKGLSFKEPLNDRLTYHGNIPEGKGIGDYAPDPNTVAGVLNKKGELISLDKTPQGNFQFHAENSNPRDAVTAFQTLVDRNIPKHGLIKDSKSLSTDSYTLMSRRANADPSKFTGYEEGTVYLNNNNNRFSATREGYFKTKEDALEAHKAVLGITSKYNYSDPQIVPYRSGYRIKIPNLVLKKEYKPGGEIMADGGDASIIPVNTPQIPQLTPQIPDNATPGIAPINVGPTSENSKKQTYSNINYGSALLNAASIFNGLLSDKQERTSQVQAGLSDNSFLPTYNQSRGYTDPNTGMVVAAFGTEIAPEINTQLPQMITGPGSQPLPYTGLGKAMATPSGEKISKSQEPTSSLDLDKKTSIYLTHQQGVAGLKAIQKAAALGVPLSEVYHGKADIKRNMAGNVGKDFYQKYGDLTASNFLDYWKGKMRSAISKAEKKSTPYDNVFQKVGSQTGFDPTYLKAISFIESSGNPLANQNKNTQYKGLFQVNQKELKKTGGNNIYDPYQNAYAAASMMAENRTQLKMKEGGEYDLSPEDLDYYRSQGYEFEEI